MLVPGGQFKKTVMQGTVDAQGVITGVAATGNGTSMVTTGGSNGAYTVLTMQIKGITTATVTFEATIDEVNWVAVEVASCASSTTLGTTATADGLYRLIIAGYLRVRARISAWSSGTIVIIGVVTA